MRLYHGTTADVAERALREGVQPRAVTQRMMWAKHPSNKHCVYLTDVYAPYFATNAMSMTDESHWASVRGAILEIDVSSLHHDLVPDEDTLEQAMRGNDALPRHWDMQKRTRHYREFLHNYRGSAAWQSSLSAMGTCAHIGAIPAHCIRRVAYLNGLLHPVCCIAWDAQISIANYRLMRHKYDALTRAAFGDISGAELETSLNIWHHPDAAINKRMVTQTIRRFAVDVHTTPTEATANV